jgi:hypothetical protein
MRRTSPVARPSAAPASALLTCTLRSGTVRSGTLRSGTLRRCAMLASLLLAACGSTPRNATTEALDERTGTTVTRLEKPVELLALEARGANLDPFAYLAPFETNRMGRRALYLWIAVPDEQRDAAPPELRLDGRPLPLATGTQGRGAGLAAQPYPLPAPWSKLTVYALDATQFAALLAARQLQLEVRYGSAVTHFAGTAEPPDALRDFGTRLGVR